VVHLNELTLTARLGYGDLDMGFTLRWFQIFYLSLSTYFVGSCLGKLVNLKQELMDVRRQYAWQRRKISRSLIEDMQAYDHDDKVDQYEFLVASLLTLGKLTSDDVRPIMDKFREMAGEQGFITLANIESAEGLENEPTEAVEDDE
jgi:hypothetical protein